MKAKRGVDESRGVSPLIVLGVALLLVVVATAGYLGWLAIGTNSAARNAAAQGLAAVEQSWDATTAEPTLGDDGVPDVARPHPGEAAWVLRIPRLDGEWPIVAGVEAEQLARGVGWYPGSALPGQVGNMAVTGHCVFNGEPFRHLFDLQVGDEVVVDTDDATFTYEIVSAPASLTVQADESWVLDPVPGKSDQIPVEALITLTTCEDLFPTADRAVGFGTLKDMELK